MVFHALHCSRGRRALGVTAAFVRGLFTPTWSEMLVFCRTNLSLDILRRAPDNSFVSTKGSMKVGHAQSLKILF